MKKTLGTILFFLISTLITIYHLPITSAIASGSTTGSSDQEGQVVVQTEDGVMYLDTQTVSDEEVVYTYQVFGSDIIIPETFFRDFSDLINRLLTLVIAISALLAFGYLIWGAISWITSGGDKGKIDAARQKMIAAVVGLIIVAASYAILSIALRFLGINSLNEALNEATNRQVVIIQEQEATESAEVDEGESN